MNRTENNSTTVCRVRRQYTVSAWQRQKGEKAMSALWETNPKSLAAIHFIVLTINCVCVFAWLRAFVLHVSGSGAVLSEDKFLRCKCQIWAISKLTLCLFNVCLMCAPKLIQVAEKQLIGTWMGSHQLQLQRSDSGGELENSVTLTVTHLCSETSVLLSSIRCSFVDIIRGENKV